jgi:SAM-dependent methyltransferase
MGLRAAGATLLLAVLLWRFWTYRRGASYSPTARRRVEAMLDLADVRPGDTVLDLGSGDGRILIEAARRGARAVGFELDPLRAARSRWRIRRAGLDARASVARADFFEADISEADVVFCYLQQWSNVVLQEKLLRELRPDAQIVSHRWTFPGLVETGRSRDGRLRAYRPARRLVPSRLA